MSYFKLQRICSGLENSAPWLILAGSGGTADILAAFMNDPQLILPDAVEKQFKEKFPAESFSWKDILQWTETVSSDVWKVTMFPMLSPDTCSFGSPFRTGLARSCSGVLGTPVLWHWCHIECLSSIKNQLVIWSCKLLCCPSNSAEHLGLCPSSVTSSSNSQHPGTWQSFCRTWSVIYIHSCGACAAVTEET